MGIRYYHVGYRCINRRSSNLSYEYKFELLSLKWGQLPDTKFYLICRKLPPLFIYKILALC